MDSANFQIIGRRLDNPQTLLFRDRSGRHFLRPACGARLIRLTTKDAQRLLGRFDYHPVIDSAWRNHDDAVGLDCIIPWDQPPMDVVHG